MGTWQHKNWGGVNEVLRDNIKRDIESFYGMNSRGDVQPIFTHPFIKSDSTNQNNDKDNFFPF